MSKPQYVVEDHVGQIVGYYVTKSSAEKSALRWSKRTTFVKYSVKRWCSDCCNTGCPSCDTWR